MFLYIVHRYNYTKYIHFVKNPFIFANFITYIYFATYKTWVNKGKGHDTRKEVIERRKMWKSVQHRCTSLP